MRILVTGSRTWKHKWTIKSVLDFVVSRMWDGKSPITLVHGDAVGADRLAGEVAEELGWEVEVYPADWERFGKKAGFIRNSQMVNLGADVLCAFIIDESKGATMTLDLARKKGMRTQVTSISAETHQHLVEAH